MSHRRLPSRLILVSLLLLLPAVIITASRVDLRQLERIMERERPGEPPWEEREKDRGKGLEEGKAWDYFEYWYGIRAYPNELIPEAAFYQAWRHAKTEMPVAQRTREASWIGIGPDNIGGRMLAVAIDPADPNVIWAGAASGGLWKSVTAGEGAAAWTRVETGFPSLSVSTVLIDGTNPQVIYLGTGEISRYARPLNGTPGARASYGIGVLKSTDGGVTWQETGLTWTFDQHRAILALRMDPTDADVIWAATSEGLYKTQDGGATWTLKHATLMAMDVVVDPTNPNKIFVSHGQLNSAPDPGIYRSTDGGDSWVLLAGGLPTTNFGRTPLAIHTPSPGGPSTVYAGVSNADSRQVIGLYRSTNDGNTWTNIAAVNWAGSQAWYDNVIGLSPHDPNLVLCGGLDWYRSTQGGANLGEVSYWYLGDMGEIPPGGPEGPPDYVHADQHALAFHPTDPQIVYIGSDGGIFKSTDGGQNWAGKNGGLVTTQFYAGFAGGYANSGIAVGGLQDNGTIKYTGGPSWSKIFGGDGGWCAIDPTNDNVIYEEYVYLNMYKSTDGGLNWWEIHPYSSSEANFIAPFVISESNPNILYAGTRGVKKTTNGGTSWTYPDGNSNWNGTPMAIIGVSFTSPDTLLAGTGSGTSPAVFQIQRSTNGGVNWTDVTAGLPDRYPTDIGFDRLNSRNVYLTFSGFGSPHVYFSADAGLNWVNRTGNLPDIPVQCVAVDPRNHDWVYVGTDLGVFWSTDGGGHWLDYNSGMPTAMILDLVIHRGLRKMRAATFGNGVYEIDLAVPSSGVDGETTARTTDSGPLFSAAPTSSPNPFRGSTSIRYRLARPAALTAEIFDLSGRRIRSLYHGTAVAGASDLTWNGLDQEGRAVATGSYFLRLSAGEEKRTVRLTVLPGN